MEAKVLVLGHKGFIGRNLVEQLPYKILTVKQDLTVAFEVEDYLRQTMPDVVIHCAARDKKQCYLNNVEAYMSVAQCNKYYDKLIYFGSGAELEDRKDEYAKSKRVIAKHMALDDNTYNLKLWGVFGKYEDYKRRFISHCLWAKYHKKIVNVNTNTYFDYMYVNDLVKIVQWFIENKPKEKAYNVCTGINRSLESIAQDILPLDLIRLKNCEGRDYGGDNKKLINEMGGFEFTPFREAVKELDGWFKGKYNQEKNPKVSK